MVDKLRCLTQAVYHWETMSKSKVGKSGLSLSRAHAFLLELTVPPLSMACLRKRGNAHLHRQDFIIWEFYSMPNKSWLESTYCPIPAPTRKVLQGRCLAFFTISGGVISANINLCSIPGTDLSPPHPNHSY
jgi:hypothetical protein